MTADTPQRVNVVEIPWFWLMMFSAAALFFVTLIAPKYAAREARRERMAEARERIDAAREAGVRAHDVQHDPFGRATADAEGVVPPIVPYMYEDFQKSPNLAWLYGLLITLSCVGGWGVYRTLSRRDSVSAPPGSSTVA